MVEPRPSGRGGGQLRKKEEKAEAYRNISHTLLLGFNPEGPKVLTQKVRRWIKK